MDNNRALVINDSRFEARVLKDMLSKLGYAVTLADEYDALKKVEEQKPHFIIANYIMENTNGDQLIQKIKSIHPESYCVLTSSTDLHKEKQIMSHVDSFVFTAMSMNIMEKEVEKAMSIKQSVKKFCSGCGEKIEGLSDKVKFCPFCGNQL